VGMQGRGRGQQREVDRRDRRDRLEGPHFLGPSASTFLDQLPLRFAVHDGLLHWCRGSSFHGNHATKPEQSPSLVFWRSMTGVACAVQIHRIKKAWDVGVEAGIPSTDGGRRITALTRGPPVQKLHLPFRDRQGSCEWLVAHRALNLTLKLRLLRYLYCCLRLRSEV
jgi:hypothetical protein